MRRGEKKYCKLLLGFLPAPGRHMSKIVGHTESHE